MFNRSLDYLPVTTTEFNELIGAWQQATTNQSFEDWLSSCIDAFQITSQAADQDGKRVLARIISGAIVHRHEAEAKNAEGSSSQRICSFCRCGSENDIVLIGIDVQICANCAEIAGNMAREFRGE